jgi:hypothetical protein
MLGLDFISDGEFKVGNVFVRGLRGSVEKTYALWLSSNRLNPGGGDGQFGRILVDGMQVTRETVEVSILPAGLVCVDGNVDSLVVRGAQVEGSEQTKYYESPESNVGHKDLEWIQSGIVSPVIIEHGGTGYSETGSGWNTWNGSGPYYHDNCRYTAGAGTGANTATYAFTGLPNGTYEVLANWAAYTGHSSNVPYAITAGGSTANVTADQRPESSGIAHGGVSWQLLATATVTDGRLAVTLTDAANGVTVADGVMARKV